MKLILKDAIFLVAIGLILVAILFSYGFRTENGIMNSYSEFGIDNEVKRGTVMTNSGEVFTFTPERKEFTGMKMKMLFKTGFDNDPSNDELIKVWRAN